MAYAPMTPIVLSWAQTRVNQVCVNGVVTDRQDTQVLAACDRDTDGAQVAQGAYGRASMTRCAVRRGPRLAPTRSVSMGKPPMSMRPAHRRMQPSNRRCGGVQRGLRRLCLCR